MEIIVKESADQLRERDPVLHKSIHQFDRATHDPRNYGGTILIDDIEVAQTLICCHCGGHFLNAKIPGKDRGWCMNCNKPVCPKRQCDNCLPWEAQMEAIERNLPIGHRTIMVAVHRAFGLE